MLFYRTARYYYCVERLSGAAAKGGIFHIVTPVVTYQREQI